MLLPTSCPCCGAPGSAPCAECCARLQPPEPAPPPLGVDSWHALFRYEGPGRDLVVHLKYRNSRSALRWLAGHLAGLVDAAEIDVVTWAPTTPERRRARGFDQAELLARGVARRLHCPCRGLLRRAPGAPQTGRSQAQRHHDLGLAAVGRVRGRVLVVDDVATTGVTLSAAATALRRAGATRITALTAARTPLRSGALPSTENARQPGGFRGHQGQWSTHRGLGGLA